MACNKVLGVVTNLSGVRTRRNLRFWSTVKILRFGLPSGMNDLRSCRIRLAGWFSEGLARCFIFPQGMKKQQQQFNDGKLLGNCNKDWSDFHWNNPSYITNSARPSRFVWKVTGNNDPPGKLFTFLMRITRSNKTKSVGHSSPFP